MPLPLDAPREAWIYLPISGLIGFVVGLVVAGVLAIWTYNSSPFRADAVPAARVDPIRPKVDAKTEAKPTGQTGAIAKDENKPDSERIVQPGAAPTASAPSAAPAPPPVVTAPPAPKAGDAEPAPSAVPRGRLWLQVGAYANRQDAENQRARFAMLGYEARVEAVDARLAADHAHATGLEAAARARGEGAPRGLVLGDRGGHADRRGAAREGGERPLRAAREALGARRILGVSCYADLDRVEAAARVGADYVGIGSMFPSTTKPAATSAPPALLGEARRRFDIPVAAIGGITVRNAPEIVAAGADMVAVIGDLFDAMDIAGHAAAYGELFSPLQSGSGRFDHDQP